MIWFSSDHHFYHTNVIRYCGRPFQTVEEMNEVLVERWNKVVAPTDVVHYLGDFSLARRAVELFRPRLNGIIHLTAGNHDHCHPAHAKKPHKIESMTQWYKDQGFASVELERIIQIGPHTVKLHHMPFAGDHEAERYTKYRPVDDGKWLLHGHVHEKWQVLRNMINVGVDVWDFAPVSEKQILAIIEK